jgi:single-strand DNA-binding protein
MAASINNVVLAGNVTRAVELRYTPKGKAVAELGLAMNRRWKTESGEEKEDVTFVDVTLWGATAENSAKVLKKGSPVLIEGRLSLETWDDKATGQKRSKVVVVAERVHFLWSAPEREAA